MQEAVSSRGMAPPYSEPAVALEDCDLPQAVRLRLDLIVDEIDSSQARSRLIQLCGPPSSCIDCVARAVAGEFGGADREVDGHPRWTDDAMTEVLQSVGPTGVLVIDRFDLLPASVQWLVHEAAVSGHVLAPRHPLELPKESWEQARESVVASIRCIVVTNHDAYSDCGPRQPHAPALPHHTGGTVLVPVDRQRIWNRLSRRLAAANLSCLTDVSKRIVEAVVMSDRPMLAEAESLLLSMAKREPSGCLGLVGGREFVEAVWTMLSLSEIAAGVAARRGRGKLPTANSLQEELWMPAEIAELLNSHPIH